MVVNTCASKLVSWFLMPWRMPSIHWQYLKVAGCRQWWFQSTHSTPTLLHSCSLSTHKSWQTEGWFLQSKKSWISSSIPSLRPMHPRGDNNKETSFCVYTCFLKQKNEKIETHVNYGLILNNQSSNESDWKPLFHAKQSVVWGQALALLTCSP